MSFSQISPFPRYQLHLPSPTSGGTTGWSLGRAHSEGVDLHKELASEGAPNIKTVLQHRSKPRIATLKADAWCMSYAG